MDKKYLEQLENKMWRTKSARFAASHRLQAKAYANLFIAAALSLLGFVASMWTPAASIVTNVSSTFSTLASLGALILTLVELSAQHARRSVNLYRNANRVNSLIERLRLAIAQSNDGAVARVGEEYHNLLEETDDNHDEMDDEYVRARKFREFSMTWFSATKSIISWKLDTVLWPSVTVLAVVVATVFLGSLN